MTTKALQAKATFDSGFNCAQSVFSVFAEELGLDRDHALRLSTAFGSGIARTQQTCGAITGALMAIGLKYGKGEQGTENDKAATYRLSQEFITAFKAKHKSTSCLQLLENLDMSNPKQMEEIKKRDLFTCKCAVYVADAVEIADKIIH